ncbi:MAG: hypothetical protein IPL61_13835 [Myxococcales bacterium]|nr:hypothetical protein [Myxococcales bacterium]
MWLRTARAVGLHRHFGYGSLLEYLERTLGYPPNVARERLRVADALAELPATAAALAAGTVPYSAVRELTRVATSGTERAWLDAMAGKTVREIEGAVAGRRPGDLPESTPDPAHRIHRLRLELSAATFALFLAARRALEETCGQPLTDDDLMAALCRGPLGDGSHVGSATDQPAYQIAVTTCPDCGRAWQDAAGRTVEIAPAAVEQASCDAEVLGRVDGAEPAVATRTIPPRVRRAVVRRDRGRCVVPGCRASRWLDVHHLRPRASGGSHLPENLAVVCTAHHAAIHDGRLVVTGRAPGALVFTHADGRPYGAPPAAPPSASDDVAAEARLALTTLGYLPQQARVAIDRARSHVGGATTLPVLVRAALRACCTTPVVRPNSSA